MLGAAILAAKAALRSGAGIVYLMTIEEGRGIINANIPEIIVLPLPDENGVLKEAALPLIEKYIAHYQMTVLAIGPGLGRKAETSALVSKCISQLFPTCKLPVVVDADALFALSQATLSRLADPQYILTPHLKEFERMFTIEITSDNHVKAAREAAKLCGQVVVLKGPGTVIAFEGETTVNPSGNEGLATAGSGDVLTGVIAALLGQHAGLYDAAKLGVFLHGLAGDIAVREKGIHGLIASDIIDALPAAFKTTAESVK